MKFFGSAPENFLTYAATSSLLVYSPSLDISTTFVDGPPATIFGAALRSAPNAESASAAASAMEPSRVFAFFIRR